MYILFFVISIKMPAQFKLAAVLIDFTPFIWGWMMGSFNSCLVMQTKLYYMRK